MPSVDEKTKFSQSIERANVEQGITHIEAIVDYCEKTGFEIEVVKDLVNIQLKKKLEFEGKELRMIKGKSSKLPL